MIDLPTRIIHCEIFPRLDDLSIVRLSSTCTQMHTRVITDKRWEDLLKKHFRLPYSTTYCTLTDHAFYSIYAIECTSLRLTKKVRHLTLLGKICDKCANINGNIVFWFTVTMPTIKSFAVILRTCKTGNFLQAVKDIL